MISFQLGEAYEIYQSSGISKADSLGNRGTDYNKLTSAIFTGRNVFVTDETVKSQYKFLNFRKVPGGRFEQANELSINDSQLETKEFIIFDMHKGDLMRDSNEKFFYK